MPLYSAAASMSGINTAGRAYFVLGAGATRRLRVTRIAITMPVASTTVPQFQICRVTVAGTTPGATLAPPALDPNDAATGASLFSGGYSSQPTVTTATPLEMATLPLTAGAGWVWPFPVPIIVTNGTANGLCIYNVAASGATTGTFVGEFTYEE
jgi:hypothetical protein